MQRDIKPKRSQISKHIKICFKYLKTIAKDMRMANGMCVVAEHKIAMKTHGKKPKKNFAI